MDPMGKEKVKDGDVWESLERSNTIMAGKWISCNSDDCQKCIYGCFQK